MMKVKKLIEKLQSLPQDLEVRTEGDEQLSLRDPNPRVEYYRDYGKGPDVPTFGKPVVPHFDHGAQKWEDITMSKVVLI